MKQTYDSLMLRSAFVSLFWGIIEDLKQRRGYKLQRLADEIGVDKSVVSRWFSGGNPNWTLNTVGEIATALNVDISVQAIDRATGEIYTPQGAAADRDIDVKTIGRASIIPFIPPTAAATKTEITPPGKMHYVG